MMMTFLIERSECDDDDAVSSKYDDDDVVSSKYDDDDVLIKRSEYDDELMLEYDDVWLMMVLIERSEYDDNDVVADRKAKVLKKMFLI